MLLTEGLQIRPGRVKHEVSFRQYYDTNWQGITPMWVLAFRKKLPLQVLCFYFDMEVIKTVSIKSHLRLCLWLSAAFQFLGYQ